MAVRIPRQPDSFIVNPSLKECEHVCAHTGDKCDYDAPTQLAGKWLCITHREWYTVMRGTDGLRAVPRHGFACHCG